MAEKAKNPKVEEARSHMKAAHKAFHKSIESWVPAGFIEHRRAARKEMLLALRSLLDAAIEHAEPKKVEDEE